MRNFAIACLFCGALGAALACGAGTSVPPDPTAGTVSGQVEGRNWTSIASAYWLGKRILLNPERPVVIQLFDVPTACSMLRADVRHPDTTRILQLGLRTTDVRSFTIPADAYASYWRGGWLPDAVSGSIDVSMVSPSMNIVGSFDVQFISGSTTGSLMGTFDAKFCPDGT